MPTDKIHNALTQFAGSRTAADRLMDAVGRFDVAEFGRLLEQAIENDVLRAQQRVAAVDAQPVPQRIVVRLAAKGGGDMYVCGASFADGDGYRLRKFSYTPDRAKAHVFGAECGLAVARQVAARGVRGVQLQEAK